MDETRFIDVCRQHMNSFYRLSYSIVGNQQDAEDAVQQALLNAWNTRHRAREAAERAYIMRIVLNESYNILRKRRNTFPFDDLQPIPDSAPAPEHADLYAAIHSLPVKLRTPFLLKYMEGMSEKEVSCAMKLPVSSVKNRLFRARKTLQHILREEDHP